MTTRFHAWPWSRIRTLMLASCVLSLPAPAGAGGFWVWETGNAADVGTAGASWGAGSDDSSTAWTNPAAMTLLERSEVGGQLSPSIYRYRFDRDSATTVSGGSGANTSFAPVLGASGVWVVNEKLRLGAATGGLAGGSLDYGNDWSGRYLVTQVALTTLGFNPGIAYRVNDWLSLGASAAIAFTTFDQKARVNNLLPGQDDGKLELKDNDLGFGGVFGVLVEPREGTRISLNYRTPIDFDLNDRRVFSNIQRPLSGLLDVTGIRNAKVELDLTLPRQVLLGISQQITEDLTVVANADWQQWSQFGAIDLLLGSPSDRSASADIESQDTWHVGVGARWRVRPRWLLTTGLSYDSSMFADSNRSPAFPIDRQIRVGGGVQYDLSDDLFMGFAYEYMNGGSARLRSGSGGPLTGTLSGDYAENELHFFTISLHWRP